LFFWGGDKKKLCFFFVDPGDRLIIFGEKKRIPTEEKNFIVESLILRTEERTNKKSWVGRPTPRESRRDG